MRISPSKLIFAFFSSFYILVILFPRGIFLGHSTLASRLWIIYNGSLYLSILLGLIYVILKILSRNIAIHQHAFFILQYYFIVIILTFMVSGSIGVGLQSIFYPIFIYLFFNEVRDKKSIVLIFDIFLYILTPLFVINTIDVFLNFTNIFHITFLGHVQVISQYSVIGFLVSAYYLLEEKRNILVAQLLLILTIINCFFSDVSLSKVIALFMIVYIISYKLRKLFWKRGRKISVVTFIASVVMLALVIFGYFFPYLRYFDFTFNGRYQIWRIVYATILQVKWFGYGLFGFQFKLPWQKLGEVGINYTHNQVLQLALDSGIVGIISFFTMIFYMIFSTKNIQNSTISSLFIFAYFCLFIIMFIESVTYYPYYFIIIVLQTLYLKLERERNVK